MIVHDISLWRNYPHFHVDSIVVGELVTSVTKLCDIATCLVISAWRIELPVIM